VGKKEKGTLRVVLDTNILISALLFHGRLSGIVELWKDGRIVPLISKETFAEFRTALEYPKFRLTRDEVRTIIEQEVLPFFEIVEIIDEAHGACKDPDDNKFISCAVSASADFIVTGDTALYDAGKRRAVKIIRAADLLRMMQAG
jgi:putative PIN family toxin of toxin-antitoxin system